MLHATGRLDLWNAEAARRYGELFCRLLDVSQDQLVTIVHEKIVRQLALELGKKQTRRPSPCGRRTAGRCSGAVGELAGGNDDFRVRLVQKLFEVIEHRARLYLYRPTGEVVAAPLPCRLCS